MEHTEQVRSEFSRQAQPMSEAPAFRAPELLARIVETVSTPPADRVLDLACGPGIVTEALAPVASHVYGLDATPAMIDAARQRLAAAGYTNVEFRVGAAEQLPWPDAHFDAVVTRLSIHHFREPAVVLQEIRRVLRPDGRLVVVDIVSSEVAEEATLHNALERLRDPSHVRMLSHAELISLVDEVGFHLLDEQSWRQERTFQEWSAIVNLPERTEPLETVLRALAQAGVRAGIDLHVSESGEVRFVHHWLFLTAQP